MSVTGTADTRPLVAGAPLLDYGTGFATAFAISAALLQREKNGKGQKISVSMMDTALLMMSSIVARHLNGDCFQPADGNQSANAAYGCHQTAQGLLMIGAYSPEQSARLWRVLGEEEEARRVSALPVTELPTRREHQLRILGKVLLHKTADEWVVILQEKGVPASRVQSIDEAITMAATADKTTFAEIPQTDTFGPGYKVPLAAFSYESNGPSLHSPPPFYGQHTDAILGELGYSHKTITSLRKSGDIE
jgi:crotonobetainyl-CoA:carnitine CoA-transferase CaiB-like acyl-CoA transferase